MARASWHWVMPAIWRRGGDPSAYALLSIDARPLIRLMDHAKSGGHRVQPTAVVLKALGTALHEVPEQNVTIRWGRVRPRDPVDAWVTLTTEDGGLHGLRIDRLDERSVIEIQQKLDAAARQHQGRGGPPGWLRFLPRPVLALVFRFAGFLIHDLRVPMRGHVDRHGFGAVHVTSVGSQGLRWTFAPIPPITRQACLLVVGQVHDAPVVEEAKVVVAPILPVSVTVDHRMVVGVVVNRFRVAFEKAMAEAERMLHAPDGPR